MTNFFIENKGEVLVSTLFLIVLATFLDPFMILMPSPVLYLALAALFILFIVFAGLIWREKSADERDEFHRMLAGRMGYLLGIGTLLTGLIIESIQGHVDSWLIFGLGIMVIGKLGGLAWARFRH